MGRQVIQAGVVAAHDPLQVAAHDPLRVAAHDPLRVAAGSDVKSQEETQLRPFNAEISVGDNFHKQMHILPYCIPVELRLLTRVHADTFYAPLKPVLFNWDGMGSAPQ